MVEMGLYSAAPAWRLPEGVLIYLRSKYLCSKVAFKEMTLIQLVAGKKMQTDQFLDITVLDLCHVTMHR